MLVKLLIECEVGLELANEGLQSIGEFMDAFLVFEEAFDVTLGDITEVMVCFKHDEEAVEVEMERVEGIIG